MFSMEEEEEEEGGGAAKRPPGPCTGASQRCCSLSESKASEDDDEDHFILPILGDSAKEICHYLKDMVNPKQQSISLPRSSFTYRVSRCHAGAFGLVCMFTCTCKDGQLPLDCSLSEEQEVAACGFHFTCVKM